MNIAIIYYSLIIYYSRNLYVILILTKGKRDNWTFPGNKTFHLLNQCYYKSLYI